MMGRNMHMENKNYVLHELSDEPDQASGQLGACFKAINWRLASFMNNNIAHNL